MRFYTHDKHSITPLVEIDMLPMLVKQMSADIVDHCNEAHFNKTLEQYAFWADHGYENALISYVSFVYHFMESFKDNEFMKSFFDPSERNLLRKAMTVYENRKNFQQKEAEKEFGPNWGHATSYYQWNPTKYNEFWD